MKFQTGQVAHALGMTGQALGNLVRDLMPNRPANRHYRYTPDEVLWIACFRHARAAGLEAFPAKAFVGGPGMRAMLEELLAAAAPDPAEAVKRLLKVPILYGARYRQHFVWREAVVAIRRPVRHKIANQVPESLTRHPERVSNLPSSKGHRTLRYTNQYCIHICQCQVRQHCASRVAPLPTPPPP